MNRFQNMLLLKKICFDYLEVGKSVKSKFAHELLEQAGPDLFQGNPWLKLFYISNKDKNE